MRKALAAFRALTIFVDVCIRNESGIGIVVIEILVIAPHEIKFVELVAVIVQVRHYFFDSFHVCVHNGTHSHEIPYDQAA